MVVDVRERCLDKLLLAKCIKMCYEIDAHVENNVNCRENVLWKMLQYEG